MITLSTNRKGNARGSSSLFHLKGGPLEQGAPEYRQIDGHLSELCLPAKEFPQ